MEAEISEDLCRICMDDLSPGKYEKLGEKGAHSVNKASIERGENISVVPGNKVHRNCRKNYTNTRAIELKNKKINTPAVVKRSSSRDFQNDAKSKCLFCDQIVHFDSANRPIDGSCVHTNTFTETINEICDQRLDDWGVQVKGRIEFRASDLHAADTVYHHSCCVNFRTGKFIPKQHMPPDDEINSKRLKIGRPSNDDQEFAFNSMCDYLERNDDEQITMSDLISKMTHFLNDADSTPYSAKHMKRKLRARYGDGIKIIGSDGRNDIVTMQEQEKFILRDFYEKSQYGASDQSRKEWIIESAARLIKNDIKQLIPSNGLGCEYPSPTELNMETAIEYLPESLRMFCEKVFVGKKRMKKIASIGQAIVQAARPIAVIAPLQLGLAVQFHHLFKSRFAIDTLNTMGFSVSYNEVLLFEKNAAFHHSDTILNKEPSHNSNSNGSLLLVADNADHNVLTLDGRGSFHGMAMLGAFTKPMDFKLKNVPRRKLSELNLSDMTRVPILDFRNCQQIASETKFCALKSLTLEYIDLNLDYLWRYAVRFSMTTPNWSGMMSIFHENDSHPGPSSITFLPMIDLYPGDLSCIYSTLSFLEDFSRRHDFPCVVTFDQPLFFKASEIVERSEGGYLKQIVVMLGSFHTLMNVLGAIGYLMEGSGIKEIISTVYGENAVDQILKGKSVQRAFRAHQMLDRALSSNLLSLIVGNDNTEASQCMVDLEHSYTQFVDSNGHQRWVHSESLDKIKRLIQKLCDELSESGDTSKLWVRYMEAVQLARNLVAADRSGKWNDHLASIQACLPLFASAGHYLYLKSAYLYLQKMQNLQNTHPNVHAVFQKGHFVVRRTNKFWAGLGCDLTIEQCFMKALKTTGGLTRGSGMTENQRDVWTMSMPILAEVNLAMQDFTEKTYQTSEQHKDLTRARMNRDQSDQAKLNEKVLACSPFSLDSKSLCNIITGEIAHEDVNVQNWNEKGLDTVSNLIGENIFLYSFNRKFKVVNLSSQHKVKVTDTKTIDPGLLFQRFLVVVNNGELSFEDVLKFELCTYPPALFHSPLMMLKADKPPLVSAVLKYVNLPTISIRPKTEKVVVDGGSLLRKIPWKPGASYIDIAKSYADFTLRKYGKATVVFDGYSDSPSTKDNTHRWRQRGHVNSVILVNPTGIFNGKRDNFLAHGSQKQRLIHLIMSEMHQLGIKTIQSADDADVLIATTAISSSEMYTTSLVGEDTDLFVLCVYYSHMMLERENRKELFFYLDRQLLKNPTVIHNIHEIADKLGQLCTALPFLHSFSGCDSTSRIFGIGKESAFKKLLKDNSTLRECARIFSLPGQDRDLIINHGERAMCYLYDENRTNLHEIRCRALSSKVIKAKSFVEPAKLPPTSSAVKFHSLRCYHQVMVFTGQQCDLNPLDWGFKEDNGEYQPILMDTKPAPEQLLKIIHCNCITGCESGRCTCRKMGLKCNSVCGPCQSGRCTNDQKQQQDVDSDDEHSETSD